jgi:alpha-tubulin suppressor-like RCC1 family protein
MIIKKTDGYLYGCGYNGYGQLGVGDTTNRSTWTQITGAGTNPLFVGNMGANTGMLVVQKSDKTIWVCGWNGYGQLGNGNTTSQSSLINVDSAWRAGNTNLLIKSVHGAWYYFISSAPDYATFAMVLDDGTNSYVKTAGDNNWNQLGTTGGARSTPFTAYEGSLSTRVKEAAWASGDVVGGMFVLDITGRLYAWGYNGYGQLGNGNTSTITSATQVAGDVTKIWQDHAEYAYGHYHTSFIQKADGLYAAGINNYGQCGVGDTTNRSIFTKVGLSANAHQNFKQLGQWSTTGSTRIYVGVTNDNTLYSWGYNGQYGIFPWNSVSNIASPVTFELMRGD